MSEQPTSKPLVQRIEELVRVMRAHRRITDIASIELLEEASIELRRGAVETSGCAEQQDAYDAAAQVRVEAIKRDAARYRWLRTRINWSDVEMGMATNRTSPIVTYMARNWTHQDVRPATERPASEHIDEYIDRARASEKASAKPTVDGYTCRKCGIWYAGPNGFHDCQPENGKGAL